MISHTQVQCFVLLAALVLSGPARAQQDVPEALRSFAPSLTDLPSAPLGEAGRTYVPAYSSVMAGGGRTRVNFAVTLSVHNTSESDPLVVTRIDYYETSGRLTQAYLKAPVAIRPYGTVQVVVAQEDTTGGLGANFVVDWQTRSAATEPAIEAVMIANVGGQSFSFLSNGRRVGR